MTWLEKRAQAACRESVSFYAEDAVLLPASEPKATGKAQIRDFFARFLASPGLGVSFGPTMIEVAKSKDMAYEVGTYEPKLNDPQGNPFAGHQFHRLGD